MLDGSLQGRSKSTIPHVSSETGKGKSGLWKRGKKFQHQLLVLPATTPQIPRFADADPGAIALSLSLSRARACAAHIPIPISQPGLAQVVYFTLTTRMYTCERGMGSTVVEPQAEGPGAGGRGEVSRKGASGGRKVRVLAARDSRDPRVLPAMPG